MKQTYLYNNIKSFSKARINDLLKIVFYLFISSMMIFHISGCTEDEDPDKGARIVDFYPKEGVTGDTITVVTENIPADHPIFAVVFGDVGFPIISQQNGVIKAKVYYEGTRGKKGKISVYYRTPQEHTYSTIKIYSEDQFLIKEPIITKIEPALGFVDDTVCIHGMYLNSKSLITVNFNDDYSYAFYKSDTLLKVVIPNIDFFIPQKISIEVPYSYKIETNNTFTKTRRYSIPYDTMAVGSQFSISNYIDGNSLKIEGIKAELKKDIYFEILEEETVGLKTVEVYDRASNVPWISNRNKIFVEAGSFTLSPASAKPGNHVVFQIDNFYHLEKQVIKFFSIYDQSYTQAEIVSFNPYKGEVVIAVPQIPSGMYNISVYSPNEIHQLWPKEVGGHQFTVL